ncbi:unnamed protein product [Brachionus calyciflorus]|uniref:FLYWCH-type domain-containing protein n=1 Tax=Brachionus calyciflorus TaxID=104777 RepID=A0A814FNV0_9BILA|nr:unnamed protein product [Brachionus calyciflorus]
MNELASAMSSLSVNNIDNIGTISSSQKGHPQLCLNGQYYRLADTNKRGECKWRSIKSTCKVRCTTYGEAIGETYNVTFNII